MTIMITIMKNDNKDSKSNNSDSGSNDNSKSFSNDNIDRSYDWIYVLLAQAF